MAALPFAIQAGRCNLLSCIFISINIPTNMKRVRSCAIRVYASYRASFPAAKYFSSMMISDRLLTDTERKLVTVMVENGWISWHITTWRSLCENFGFTVFLFRTLKMMGSSLQE